MDLPEHVQAALNDVVPRLQSSLHENLHSCILYGSAIRGDIDPDSSDINLLIILRESTPQAHAVLAEVLRPHKQVSPFVLGLAGLERSLRAFAVKFRSIGRNYRLLHGVDFLAHWSVDEGLVRFLCEQSLRNLRLRSTHAFIVFGGQRKRYSRYLIETVPSLFAEISEAIRCAGTVIPTDRAERVPVFQNQLGCDISVLNDLLALKQQPRTLDEREVFDMHSRLYALLSRALAWMESRWPSNPIQI